MQAVGVIGAGQMGAGIAQVSAQAGYRVLLADVDKARAEAGKTGIAKRLARDIEKGKIDAATRDQLLDRIEPVDSVGRAGGRGRDRARGNQARDLRRGRQGAR